MKLALFLLCVVSGIAWAWVPPCRLQQTIVRAPEMEVIELLTRKTRSDAEISAQLHQWLREGRAKIVSDVSATCSYPQETMVRVGTDFVWWTMLDQLLFDAFAEYPIEAEPMFIGTTLEHSRNGDEWLCSFSPRQPLMVDWPVSWPGQVSPKLDWTQRADTFEQTVQSRVQLPFEGTQLLAAWRPADQFETRDEAGRWIDLAEISAESEQRVPADLYPLRHRTVSMIFAVPDDCLDDVLTKHRTAGDDAVLSHLLDETKAQRAMLSSFSCCRSEGDARVQATSVRKHWYPTEMPTIPSAWNEMYVGDRLEADVFGNGNGVSVSIDADLMTPPHAEFALSIRHPELVMWWPEPVTAGFRAEATIPAHGARLVGFCSIPSFLPLPKELRNCKALVAMIRHDVEGLPPDKADHPEPANLMEHEGLVFEIKSADAARYELEGWQPGDDKRLAAIRKLVDQGKARLLSRAWGVTLEGHDIEVRVAQQKCSVAESDNRFDVDPQQFRPTGIETYVVGGALKAGVSLLPDESNATLDRYTGEIEMKYDVSQPHIPTLQEQLISLHANNDEGECAKPELYQLVWKMENEAATGRLVFGKHGVKCLGAKSVPGERFKDKCYVGFVSVHRAGATN